MSRIPAFALILGLLGLIPFLWGALMTLGLIDFPIITPFGGNATLMGTTDGTTMMIAYGAVILPFMSGVLWGFATHATGGQAALAYALSVVPVLWWILVPFDTGNGALVTMICGYLGLLGLDYIFATWALAPTWWMALRIQLTTVVVVCLATGLLV